MRRAPDEARNAQAALAKATAEAELLERRLKRIDKAFVCAICCTNDVDTVLAPCGHMMCSSWYVHVFVCCFMFVDRVLPTSCSFYREVSSICGEQRFRRHVMRFS